MQELSRPSEVISASQRRLISQITKNWYWFILFLILGVVMSLLYFTIKPRQTLVSATLLIQKDPTLQGFTPMTRNIGMNLTTNKKNQAGFISSYSLNMKTLEDLNWKITWYKKKYFLKEELFLASPYECITEASNNLENAELEITRVSETTYEIKCDHVSDIDGVKTKIEFQTAGQFGERFKNRYFNFILRIWPERRIEVGEIFILRFNEYESVAAEYIENMRINFNDDEADLITVSLKSENALKSSIFLNKLIENFLQKRLEDKNRIARNTVTFIDSQLTAISNSLTNSEQKFSNFRSENKVVDLTQEGTNVLQRVEVLETELVGVRNKIEYYKNLQDYLNKPKQSRGLTNPSISGVIDPALNIQVIKLNDLTSQREVLSYSVPETNPDLIALDKEILYTKTRLSELLNNLINIANVELRNLLSQKGRVDAEIGNLPKTEQSFINVKRSRDLNNDMYNFLRQKRAEADIALASNIPEAIIVDKADAKRAEQLNDNIFLVLIAGIIISVFIPLIYIIVQNLVDSRIKTTDEVRNQIGLPIAGFVPTNKLSSDLPTLAYPNSVISESFRALSNNVRFLLNNEKQKVIAVQSSIGEEGKSFIAANLAVTLAQAKYTVLLIETDFVNPSLYNLLEQDNKVGSIEMTGDNNIDPAIFVKPTKVEGLSFFSIGRQAIAYSNILTDKILQLIPKLKGDFDFLILDNSPAELVSSSKVIGQFANINLFVLRLNYSTSSQIKFIQEIQNEQIVANMAIVLNCIFPQRKVK